MCWHNIFIYIDTMLLSFRPLGDETSQNAAAHVEHLTEILAEYSVDKTNVAFMVLDNCAVNCKIASDMDIPMIGCASHRLNLAVQKHVFERVSDTITKVHELMKKLKRGTRAALLASRCAHRAAPKNDTRWTSTFDMLERYQLIKEHLHLFEVCLLLGRIRHCAVISNYKSATFGIRETKMSPGLFRQLRRMLSF